MTEQRRGLPILALWSAPRCRSTAFAHMMSQRGDFAVMIEPFELSTYRSEEKRFGRFEEVNPEFNYPIILKKLRILGSLRADWKRLFIKDHAYYVLHIADEAFLSYFQHSFLIRHPEQALPSYHHRWPDLTLEETGYEELWTLFDRVANRDGVAPPVIDADDLMRDPESTVRAYCHSVGIPFVESALRWECIPWEPGVWHDHLVTTRGFEEQTDRPYVSVHESDFLMRLHDACLPWYERLHRQKIPVGSSD